MTRRRNRSSWVAPAVAVCLAASGLAFGVTTARAATTTVSAVSAGQYHSCAVTTDDRVECWGNNVFGQLGDGTTASSSTPVDVTGPAGAVATVSAGGFHTCAVVGGGVECWGSDSYGQLGDGNASNSSTPVAVVGLTSGIRAVSAGASHTCALTAGGAVKCWGNNGFGQLGDGTTTSRSTPVDVAGLAGGVVAISAGAYDTCAVLADGGVRCWGNNGSGQLGDGSTSSSSTPVAVVGLTGGVSAVSAGNSHTCALTDAGGVECWGGNGSGQLGDGTTTNRPVPAPVSGLASGMRAVSAGSSHTCALTGTGSAKCWGYNGSGRLGDGTTASSSTPVDVSGLTGGGVAVAAGANHTCVLTTGGGLVCWGYNGSGQLGDGTTTSRSTPEVIFAPTDTTSSTTLTVTAASGDFGDPTDVSAQLTGTSSGQGVAGKVVTFDLDGSASCSATTDAGGIATCSITPEAPAGTYPLAASFAGDAGFAASSGSADFVVVLEPTAVTYTGSTLVAAGAPATLSGVLVEDGAAPVSGRTLTFALGDGPGAPSCAAVTDSSGTARCAIAAVDQAVGPGTATVTFAGDGFYRAASASTPTLLFADASNGFFVVGDRTASGSVTFRGPDWSKRNVLSRGPAPSAFKGFEATLRTPVCGGSWTADVGESTSAPTSTPPYMAVIVSSRVTRSGATVSGDVVHVAIVRTDRADAVHPGGAVTGEVVARLC